MIQVTKISTQWGESPIYRNEIGNEYTEKEVYKNYANFDIVGRDRKLFIKAAQKYNARQSSRHTARANFGGKWDSGMIVKEQLTDTLMGVQR